MEKNTDAKRLFARSGPGQGWAPGSGARRFLARGLLILPRQEVQMMLYQPGDYVCPADLPRPIVCRVQDVESLSAGGDVSQILKLEPLEGPWPSGTQLIRLDAAVVPVPARTPWRGRAFPVGSAARTIRGRVRGSRGGAPGPEPAGDVIA